MKKIALLIFIMMIQILYLQGMQVDDKLDDHPMSARNHLAFGRQLMREEPVLNYGMARYHLKEAVKQKIDLKSQALAVIELAKLYYFNFKGNGLYCFDRLDHTKKHEEIELLIEIFKLKRDETEDIDYGYCTYHSIRSYYSQFKVINFEDLVSNHRNQPFDFEFDPIIGGGKQFLANGVSIDHVNPLNLHQGVTLLYQASSGAGKEAIKFLINNGANIHVTTSYKDTPLHNAAFHSNLSGVEQLVAMGANIDAKNAFGLTSLHYAVMMGDKELARLLITLKAPLNEGDNSGKTPLHWAVILCHREIVQLLLSYGADRSKLDNKCVSPLDVACKEQYKEIEELLRPAALTNLMHNLATQNYEFGKHLLREKDPKQGIFFLERAAKQDDDKKIAVFASIELAQFFIGKGKDQKQYEAYLERVKNICETSKDEFLEISFYIIFLEKLEQLRLYSLQYPALWKILIAFSLEHKFPKLCEAVIDQMAGLSESKKPLQETKLTRQQEAEINHYLRKLFLIDSKTSDVHFGLAVCTSRFLRNLLSCIEQEYPGLALKLIAAGEDLHQTDYFGERPLHAAVRKGYTDVARELLRLGADVNATDIRKSTPLHEAITTNQQDCVRLLVSSKASLSLKTGPWHHRPGLTPLQQALASKNSEIAHILIDQTEEGLSIENNPLEIPDSEENRPLHTAASKGMLTAVDKLILRGCQMNSTNKQKNTPIHEAVLSGAKHIVRRFLFAGANINVCNHNGDSPLHSAARAGNSSMVELLTTLPKLAPFSDANTAQRKIFTALQCIRRYAQLPRDLIFKIFTTDDDVVKDFAVVLLRGAKKLGNRPETAITNTTQWRLLIEYTIDGRSGKSILVPNDLIVLPAAPKQITNLKASIYGTYWSKMQLSSLNLLTHLYEEAAQNPDKNIEITIDGGDEGLREYTRPFIISKTIHESKTYEPASCVPASLDIIEAFPCLYFKVKKKEMQSAEVVTDVVNGSDERPRLLLKLPPDATMESVDIAYELLLSLWERELLINAQNYSFIRMVLANISAAYVSIKEQKPFKFYFPIDRSIGFHMQPNTKNILALKFFNKKNCNEHDAVLFFTELCIANDQEAIFRRNSEGKTACQCAIENKQLECVRLLSEAESNLQNGKRREWYYKLMQRLLYGTYDLRVIEGKKAQHISNHRILSRGAAGALGWMGPTMLFAALIPYGVGPVSAVVYYISFLVLPGILERI